MECNTMWVYDWINIDNILCLENIIGVDVFFELYFTCRVIKNETLQNFKYQ